MAFRPCLTCGRLTKDPRCPSCRSEYQRAVDRSRGTTTARGYGSAWAELSTQIIQRDQGVCWICQQPGADTADHLIPKAHGGSDDPTNLAAAHRACNGRRGGRTRRRPGVGR